MSSYLYIVKYELPIVIQSFTGASGGSVASCCHRFVSFLHIFFSISCLGSLYIQTKLWM